MNGEGEGEEETEGEGWRERHIVTISRPACLMPKPCVCVVYAPFIIASMLHHHRIFEPLGSDPVASEQKSREEGEAAV